jgi:hypothetical protein
LSPGFMDLQTVILFFEPWIPYHTIAYRYTYRLI